MPGVRVQFVRACHDCSSSPPLCTGNTARSPSSSPSRGRARGSVEHGPVPARLRLDASWLQPSSPATRSGNCKALGLPRWRSRGDQRHRDGAVPFGLVGSRSPRDHRLRAVLRRRPGPARRAEDLARRARHLGRGRVRRPGAGSRAAGPASFLARRRRARAQASRSRRRSAGGATTSTRSCLVSPRRAVGPGDRPRPPAEGYTQFATFHPTFLYEFSGPRRDRAGDRRRPPVQARPRAGFRPLPRGYTLGGSGSRRCGSTPSTTSPGCG